MREITEPGGFRRRSSCPPRNRAGDRAGRPGGAFGDYPRMSALDARVNPRLKCYFWIP